MQALALESCVRLLERGVVDWCAPTLGGLKPASMFSVARFHELGRTPCGRRVMAECAPRDLAAAVEGLDARLAPLGVRLRVLTQRDGSSMLFVWRPDLLSRFAQRDAEAALLELEGYDVADPAACVELLRSRVRDFDACPRNPDGTDRFPHEVGFLLGYPLDDVMGFVRDRRAVRARGCWNVYSDVPRACRVFRLYDACLTMARLRRDAGDPLESLVEARPHDERALLALYA